MAIFDDNIIGLLTLCREKRHASGSEKCGSWLYCKKKQTSPTSPSNNLVICPRVLKPLASKPERCRHGKKSGFRWTPETATPNRISSRRGTHPKAERIPCWPRLRNCNQVDQTPFALTRTKAWRILWINSLLDRSLRRGDFGPLDNVLNVINNIG